MTNTRPRRSRKKSDKDSIVNFAVSFCSAFALIFTISLLFVASAIGNNRGAIMATASLPLQAECDCLNSMMRDDPSMGEAIELFPAEIEGKISDDDYIVIAVDDNGYKEKRIVAVSGESKMLGIANRGEKYHSFVIDGLDINSGMIGPGETKTVVLEGVPDKSVDYLFYSGASDDINKDGFSGTLVIGK